MHTNTDTQTHAHAYAHNAPLESPRCAASFTTPAARDRTRPHSPTPSPPPPRPPPTPAPPSCPLPRRSTAHFSLSTSFPAPFLINPLSQRQRALPTRHGSTTSRQQHHATHTHAHTHTHTHTQGTEAQLPGGNTTQRRPSHQHKRQPYLSATMLHSLTQTHTHTHTKTPHTHTRTRVHTQRQQYLGTTASATPACLPSPSSTSPHPLPRIACRAAGRCSCCKGAEILTSANCAAHCCRGLWHN